MTRQAHTGTTPIRVGSLGAVALLSSALLLPVSPTAQAMPLPLNPQDPAVAQQWINPLLRAGESDENVSLQLTSAAPEVLTPGDTLELTFVLSNHSDEVAEELQLQPQRADPPATNAHARQLIGYEASAYPYYGAPIQLEPLAPGESREVQVSIPTDPAEPGGLSISAAGVYPLLFALRGQRAGADHVGFSTERFLLSVSDPVGPAIPEAADAAATAAPSLTLLYPLSSYTDILPGETGDSPGDTPLILGSERLAEELAEGGRLDRLLAEYRAALDRESGAALRAASCLAVDPALLDTVDRMSRGYLVDDSRPMEIRQSQRLRDSWTDEEDRDPATPGTGQTDAAAWLEKLREIAAESCIIALPWANSDLDAVHASSNQWLMREALERGPYLIRRILGVTPVTNVVIPGSGYVSTATAPALGWADLQTGIQAQKAAEPVDPADTDETAGLQEAWENSALGLSDDVPGSEGEPLEATLDDTTPPDASAVKLPAPPATTVSVLVAENSVWKSTEVDRFAELAPGIRSVSYQGSLAATLASTGVLPETVGYSNPETRFDFRIDSPTSRDLTAAANIRLAAAELSSQATFDEQGELTADPLFLMPPTELAPETAGTLLATAGELLSEQAVTPLSFEDYLNPSPEQQERLATAVPNSTTDATAFGSPFDDPTVFSDGEVLRASQQANYTDDLTRIMGNDPAIALTRYEFTAPLRRDLLLALTGSGRRSYGSFWDSVQAADHRLNGNREMLQALRSSVSLIPPGNVYTRTSESSPLLIVAQNRLPLPAQAKITYQAPAGATLHVPAEIRIPAQGSISLQMTADLPDGQDFVDIILGLSTSDGAAISDPVEISVQTRSGFFGTSSVAAVLVLALALALIFRVGSHRRRSAHRRLEDTADTAGTTVGEDAARPARRVTPRRGGGHADENSGSPKPPGRS
ncbi:hypothetical protein [Corynebacterium sp. A21]|uniref:hypothetical protein n=1 Tax=Corynebacterium sp. A21 TaxID=3457318 RepID=UPI003FD37CC6